MARLRRLSIKALAAVVIWGLSFVATRIALQAITPSGLVGLRMAMASVVLLLIAGKFGQVAPPPGDTLRIIALGLILAGHLWIQSIGLLKTTATNTGWIIGFCPVTIALGAWLFLKQSIRPLAWLGIAVGTGGVGLISLSTGLSFSDAKLGDLLQLTSCVTWAAYTLIAVGSVERHGSLRVTVWVVMVAALAMSPSWAGCVKADGLVTLPVVFAVGFLGMVCSGLAFWLWASAVGDIGSTAAGAYLYLEPLVTWLAAAVVLHEHLKAVGLLGGIAVLGGVWLVAVSRAAAAPA